MTMATQPATLSSVEVCRQTGLTYKQVDTWARWGYLRPRQTGPGSGHLREWSQAEVDIARMMARLVALGITPENAAVVARDPSQRWRWLADVIAAAKGEL
jgi:DNA-binding transcriptional MerR regulator